MTDTVIWDSALARLPASHRDIYFHADYQDLHAEAASASACLQVCGQPPGLLISGLRHPLADPDGWDLQSVNGYGGPLADPDLSAEDRDLAWEDWRRQLADSGGVAAFFRLHPLLANEHWLPPDAQIRLERTTVYVPVAGGQAAVWQQTSGAHRNMVRKAQKLGLTVHWDRQEDWTAAGTLYAEAMRRLQAPDRLHFSAAYFDRLRQMPWAALAAIRDDHGLAAMAIFLHGPVWSHYHLAARRTGAGNHLANALLQAGIERTIDLGLAGCHLGGGVTSAADDPLLNFKRSLGGTLLPFKVAGLILDRRGYDRRISAWSRQAGRSPHWFLGYREPMPTMTGGSD